MAERILVSAAASLTDAFLEIGALFHKQSGITVRFNFGGSGTLARQIQAGAPADVFVSASPKEMDLLQKARRIMLSTGCDVATNRLVLIAPSGSRLRGWNDLRDVRRIAVGQPDAVPAGYYARETLQARRLWKPLQGSLVYAGNVRQVLAYVATGDVEAGIVFATDARIEAKRVQVIAQAVPEKDHLPVLYPAAVVSKSRNEPAARRFIAFLQTPQAQTVLKQYGFAPPPQSSGRKQAR
ncbi:MAG: molybdate ABC transporter substrate-binding protein [Armatimonadaceae bacterium]